MAEIEIPVEPLIMSGGDDGQAAREIMAEKITKLEKKVESQGDEIALLKSALADALRRLKCLEEQKAIGGSTKAKRSTSASDSVPTLSKSQGKKNERVGMSPNNSFVSSPAVRSSPRPSSGDYSAKKTNRIRRKSSSR